MIWPGVKQAVTEIFGGNIGQPPDTHIWYTDSQPRPRIYDCFIFGGEIGMAETRIRRLWDTVDRFIISEATKTHSGKPKELEWQKHLEHMAPYLSKITYLVVNDLPEVEGTITDKSWSRERYHRDSLMRGLTGCRDSDLVIISDCDELPSVEAIKSYNGCNDIRSLEMTLYYYDATNRAEDKWNEAKILPYGLLKQHSPCWARYQQCPVIPNGGDHYSYFGGVEAIIRKIENTAHQEYNTDYFKNPERIKRVISEHSDIFERPNIKFVHDGTRTEK